MAVENKWEIDDLHTNVSLYAGPIKRKACETDRLSKRQCTGNVSDLVSLPSMEELTGDNNLIFGDVDFESSSVLAIGQTEFDPNRFVYRNNVASVVNSPNAPQVMKMKALLKVLNDPENQCLAIHGADIDVRRALLCQTYHALQLFLGVTGMTKFSEFSQQLPKHQRVKEEHYEKLLECLSAPISGESMYWLVMNCRKGNGWSYGVDLRVSLRVLFDAGVTSKHAIEHIKTQFFTSKMTLKKYAVASMLGVVPTFSKYAQLTAAGDSVAETEHRGPLHIDPETSELIEEDSVPLWVLFFKRIWLLKGAQSNYRNGSSENASGHSSGHSQNRAKILKRMDKTFENSSYGFGVAAASNVYELMTVVRDATLNGDGAFVFSQLQPRKDLKNGFRARTTTPPTRKR